MINSVIGSDDKIKKFPINRELRSLKIKDFKILINPNTQDIFIDSEKYSEEIAEYRKTDKDYIRLIPPKTGPPRSKSLCIQPTGSCNLDCTYCFCQYYESNRAHFMDFEMARRAIDMFIPPIVKEDDNFSVGYFGGEPTCAYDIVRDITYYALGRLKNQKKLHFHMTTNATLIDDKWIKFFEDTGVRWTFIVSVDGPPEIHNKTRITPEGKGSYNQMLEGLKKLCNITDSITLRGTFPPDIENMHLVDRVKHLNSLIHQGYGNWVSVEPTQLSENKCLSQGRPGIFTGKIIRRLQEEYYDLADWFIRGISNLNIVSEEKEGVKMSKFDGKIPIQNHINKLLRRFMYKELSVTECGAGVGYMTLDDHGDLYACHRLNGTKIGNVFYGINEIERAKWLDNRIYLLDKCMKCWARYFCGGPCRQNTLFNVGEIHKPRHSSCAIKAAIYKANLYIMAKMYELGQYNKLELAIPKSRFNKKIMQNKAFSNTSCNINNK